MATVFTWVIERLDCNPAVGEFSNVVVTAYWRCNGSDGEYVSTTYGSCSFSTPGEPFVNYQDLTQEEVLNWCWSNGVDKLFQESIVDSAIQSQINPPVITMPLPW